MLIDTHYHFDFIEDSSNRREFIKILNKENIQIVAQTVIPSSFIPLYKEMEESPMLSLGFHPWWIESKEQAQKELEIFEETLSYTRFIGEIGLDFYPRRLEEVSQELQEEVFRRVLLMVKKVAPKSTKPYILSVHTVRSASRVLDIIEEIELLDNNVRVIFHHFNGTNDELTRIRRLGCYISVHPRMLTIKKGRAYLQQVEKERILLETDMPSSKTNTSAKILAKDLKQALNETVEKLSKLRGEDMASVIKENQAKLY